MAEKSKWTKNEIIATVFDVLASVSFIVIVVKGFQANNITEIWTWALIPLAFLVFGSLFRIAKIGAILVSIIEFMDVGGMPLVGLIILSVLFAFYMYSDETNQSKIFEVAKYFVGFTAGAFVQKKRTKTI